MNSIFTDLALIAIIAILVYGRIRKPQPDSRPDTLDRMVGDIRDAALDAYLGLRPSVPSVGDLVRANLPGPVATSRLSLDSAQGTPGRAGESGWNWALVAFRQKAGWHAQSIISAARAGRDAARHEIRMAGIAARLAEPLPEYLVNRPWHDATGSFAAIVDGGVA